MLGTWIVFGAASVWVLGRSWRNTRLSKALKSAGGQFGLEVVKDAPLSGVRLEGEAEGFWVSVEARVAGGGVAVRIEIDGSGTIPADLELKERISSETPGLRSGDDDFDRAVLATGPELELWARLGPRARKIFTDHAHTLALRSGRLSFVDHGALEAQQLDLLLERLIALASDLSLNGRELPAALEERATGDPNERVRASALELLLDRFAAREETDRASLAALADPNTEVRLLGALHIGREALDVVEDALSHPEAGRIPGDLTARVFRASALLLDAPVLSRWIGSIVNNLGAQESPLALAAVTEVDRVPAEDALRILSRCVRSPAPSIADVAVERLARIGSPAEGLLLSLLDSSRPELVLRAARGLGSCGSPNALAPLLEIAEHGSGALQKEAAAAREQIRARFKDILAPGRLSLTTDEGVEGRLSIEEDPTGALSEPRPEPNPGPEGLPGSKR
jgi:hypothetical protein